MESKEPAWQPTEKQSTFLAAPEFEVMYGGAAGGGKSDALLIDSMGLQQNAIGNRNYQAIVFRRTYPELKDLIDRSLDLFPVAAPGAKYNKAEHVWTFPSGARIELGHMQHERDRLKYRGRAFQYVGFDELTLWPTDKPYLYLIGRIRSADPSLTCYVRSTTNPDGPGFDWVQERFNVPESGKATLVEYTVKDEDTGEEFRRVRRFIPATLSDNPFLKDTDYRLALLELPPDERAALLRGLWIRQSLKGAYYADEMKEAQEQGRILRIPHLPNVPVDTYWDLGANDTTAIWFRQRVGMENRFLACYENSGEGLAHFVKVLLEKGYVYGTHYLPHDAQHQKLGKNDTQSNLQMLQDLMPGHRFEVVPRIDDVLTGINETRAALSSCYWDAEGCADGLKALRSYRKKWDEDRQAFLAKPLHDWSSNYADAFRQFGQTADENTGGTWRRSRRDQRSWRTA